MTTSGQISSTLTARQIVTEAVNMVSGGQGAISAEDAATAMRHLNLMLKSWQADGAGNQWRIEDIAITWPANTPSVTLDINYLRLENLRYQSSGIDQDIEFISLSDYASIPVKLSQGFPLQATIRKTRSTLEMLVWPVPTTTVSLFMDGERVIEDVTDLDETIDVPQEWLETAVYSLAGRLIIPFKMFVSDATTAAEIKQRAAILYQTLKSSDQETGSVYVGVDNQGWN